MRSRRRAAATLREWMGRLRGALRPQRRDAELEEELRCHLELEAERAERSGLAPGDARREAALRSGGVAQAMEALRDQRGLPWLDSLQWDLRYAWRAVASRPGFAAVAILTLGAGLGLCLTVVTLVNAYLVRSMPYPSAERIHWVGLRTSDGGRLAGLEQVDWSGLDDLVEQRIAWDSDAFALLGGAFPETVRGGWVSRGFLAGLGLRPELGRLLDERDYASGGPTPVLISHELWSRRFGGDPGVLGRQVRAFVRDSPSEAETLTIVGVVAPFWHINPHRDVFGPLRRPAAPNLVRLRPGVDAATVADRITALVRDGARVPDGWQARVTGLQESYVAGARPTLTAVLLAAGLVLLIACANVAVLLLVRSTRRRHEMAIRLALGASRTRLVRLLGLEALLLGGLATALGGGLSVVLARAAAPFVEDHFERRLPGGAASALTLDPMLVAALLAGGVVLTSALTLVPLVTLRATSVTGALKAAGRGTTEGRTARRLRSLLIGAEVAAALALLASSGLLIRTSAKMLGADPGFRARGLLMADVSLRTRAYPDGASRARFYERLLERIDGAGGAGRSALGSEWPLYPLTPRRVQAVGLDPQSAQPGVTQVTAGYFAALGLPLLDGTSFDEHDRPGGEPVVVVSQGLARRLWPGGRAVGQQLRIDAAGAGPESGAEGVARRVVGVVRDVARVDYHDGRVHSSTDALDVYVPLLQEPGPAVHLFVRDGASAPDALRTAVAGLDPEVAVEAPRIVADLLDESRSRPRQMAWVLSSFAAFAALIALVGVYSVCAYSVRQREREIGVRLVVGADPTTVTRLFVREGGFSIGTGLAAGLLVAAALGQVLRSQLFGVEPLAPGVLAAATALFAACGGLALWWPARRAARIDPARVLKDE